LNFADRLVIASRLGAGVVGVYAAAYSLARLVRVIYKPISLALLPVVSKAWDSGDRQQSHWLLSNTLRYYLLVAVPTLVSVTVLGPTVILLLSGEISDPVLPVLIALIGAGFLALCIQLLFGVVFQLIKETHLIALSKLISATTYILLLVLAVPRWGMLGGAFATAVGFGMDLVITVALLKREYRIRISPIFLIKLSVAGLLMAGVEMLILEESLMRLLLAGLGGVSVFTAFVLITGAVGRREFRFLLNSVLHLTRPGAGQEDE
jgi:O-antigen/teichoic acid export membrane protein